MNPALLESLLKPALSHPDVLRVQVEPAGEVTIYRIFVHGADYGRVCGARGANLAALNAILVPVSENARVVLAEALTRDRQENVPLDPSWDPAPIIRMLREWHAAANGPGTVEISKEPRGPGIYDVFFSVTPPDEILNPLAKWASVAARGHGGKIFIEGAHYSTPLSHPVAA